MKESYANIDCSIKLLSISQGLTGKMAGMPAVTSSSLCNENCLKNSQIPNSVCQRCYTRKYLLSRPLMKDCYQQNSNLLSSSLIPTKQLPFINAKMCRLESFGDVINITHLDNYVRLIRKNSHCNFALFTKRYTLITEYFKQKKQPKNLSIIISSLLLNNPLDATLFTDLNNLKIFTVYEKAYADKNKVVISCGKNKCVNCRKCFTPNRTPIYITELLK